MKIPWRGATPAIRSKKFGYVIESNLNNNLPSDGINPDGTSNDDGKKVKNEASPEAEDSEDDKQRHEARVPLKRKTKTVL